MRKAIILIVLAFLLVFYAAPVYAIPALPHAFYGSVTVNGSPASVGTQVSATATGATTGIPQNPVTTTVAGQYGTDGFHLLVQGDITPGATITFHVTNANGTTAIADVTATFEAGGGPTVKNLIVTIAAPPPFDVGFKGGVGGGPTPQPTVETSLFGTTGSFDISNDGEVLETFTATSADGNLTLTVPEGTIALDKNGDPLSTLTTAIDSSPPDPPEGANIIGLTYDFGPDGATFDPPITIKYTYDPADIPEGVAEEDLVIECYLEDIAEWEECLSTVNLATHTVTALVEHFTSFAIIAVPKPAAFVLNSLDISPAEVGPGEKVNISISVANTGGTEGTYAVVLKINGVKEAEKSITIAAGSSQLVSFSVIREAAGRYIATVDGISGSFVVVVPAIAPPPPAPVPPPPAPAPAPPPPAPAPPPPVPAPPPPAPPNWPLIGGIIAAVVVVALLIYFLVVRRRA